MDGKTKLLSTSCRKGRQILLLTLATALMLTPSMTSWGDDLAQLLSGRLLPLSMQLKDLSGEWLRVTIHGSASASGNVEVNVNGNTNGSTTQNNLLDVRGSGQAYVTKGQTVSASGQTYLVAYRLPSTALDMNSLLQTMATKTPPELPILTPESSLRLSLLNVQAIGSIEDVRAFDMKWEIAQSQEAAQKLANLLKASEAAKPAKPPQGGNPQKPEKK